MDLNGPYGQCMTVEPLPIDSYEWLTNEEIFSL
jgi:hypothetical protein